MADVSTLMKNAALLAASNEFAKYPKKRQSAILEDFKALPVEEQQEYIDALTFPKDFIGVNVKTDQGRELVGAPLKTQYKQNAKDTTAAVIDTGAQLAGAAAGTALLPGPGTVGGEMAGAVLGNKVNQALGLREGNPLALGWDDALTAAVPGGVRALGATVKATTRSGRKILEKYDQQKAVAQGKGNTAVMDANLEAKAANEANQAKIQEYVQGNNQTDAALLEHESALVNRPKDAQGAVQAGNYKADYATSKAARANSTALVDPTDFNDTAKQLGVEFRQPAEPLQSKKYANLTEALSEFGAATQPTTTTSSLVGPSGQPITTTTPGQPAGISVDRAIATQAKLGQLIGKLRRGGGEELGAAKQLYASMDDTLRTTANQAAQAGDTATADAINYHLSGNAGFRKQMAMDDYLELFGVNKGYTNKPGLGREVKSEAILNRFENLVQNDRFFKGSFTKDELAALRSNLFEPGQLPAQGIPARPQYPKGADVPVEPDYSKAFSPLPEVHPANFPFGRMIVAGMLGGNAGAAALGQQGSNNLMGWLARGAVALPHGVSNYMLATPERQEILRKISNNGLNILTPERVTAITTIAKKMGYSED